MRHKHRLMQAPPADKKQSLTLQGVHLYVAYSKFCALTRSGIGNLTL